MEGAIFNGTHFGDEVVGDGSFADQLLQNPLRGVAGLGPQMLQKVGGVQAIPGPGKGAGGIRFGEIDHAS